MLDDLVEVALRCGSVIRVYMTFDLTLTVDPLISKDLIPLVPRGLRIFYTQGE